MLKWISIICVALFVGGCTQRILKKNSTTTFPVHPLANTADLDLLLKEIGDKSIVLIGEASHGTHEFYAWRNLISKRLIEEKGFQIIALETDWSNGIRMNDFLNDTTNHQTVRDVLSSNKRWPSWLWNNAEMADFLLWLKTNNNSHHEREKTSLYGLDLFSISESLSNIIKKTADPDIKKEAENTNTCFSPYSDAMQYARMVKLGKANCSKATEKLFHTIAMKQKNNGGNMLILEGLVVKNGEAYFRTLALQAEMAWNIRESHMLELIHNIYQLKGERIKLIIWAHNAHVGDAHFTDMSQRGRTNLSELLRNEYGTSNVYIIGMDTYKGFALAATNWGDTAIQMALGKVPVNSWEYYFHQLEPNDKLILTKEIRNWPGIYQWRGQRGIGVVYDSRHESMTASIIPGRYDALLFIDSTNAIIPFTKL